MSDRDDVELIGFISKAFLVPFQMRMLPPDLRALVFLRLSVRRIIRPYKAAIIAHDGLCSTGKVSKATVYSTIKLTIP